MKHLFLSLAVLGVIVFSSCSQSEETIPEGKVSVNFRVHNFRQYVMDELTRASSVEVLDHLAFAVYDAASGSLVQEAEVQDVGDEDYGSFSATLSPGNYRMVFLGYNGKETCQLTSPTSISFSNSYVPQTFLYSTEMTVDADAADVQTITLSRVVSALKVTIEDAIPEGVKKFRLSASGGGTVLNAQTGLAPSATGKTHVINVPDNLVGTKGVSLTTFLYLTSDAEDVDFTVEALDANGAVVRSREFKDVPMGINVMSCYKGSFFDASSSYRIEVETDWADTFTYTY